MSGERVLISRHSAFNKIVVTEDEEGFRILRFGEVGARQSMVKLGEPGHLELEYARLIPACLAFVEAPRHILLVGLGGGSLPAFFHLHFPEMMVDVVEIDEVVVDVARTHCGFHTDGRLHVFVEDGRDYIERCRNRYDLIILDSFGIESIPEHLATLEFLQAARAALTTTGIVVANVWGRAMNGLYDRMLHTYRAAFEDVYVLDVPDPGTKIFVALPTRRTIDRTDFVTRAEAIAVEGSFGYNVTSCIKGFRHSDAEPLRSSAVLMDAL